MICCSRLFVTKQVGDKILLPPSAFDTLARLQVDYPMLFRLSVPGTSSTSGTNTGEERRTHCGVLEFTAEEGCCYIPFWMMQNLLIEEGTLITVTNVSLPKATFVKLQPQSVDFLEISNPRAVLEHALRNFSCVTINDIIQIPYNNKNYHFALKEVNPSPAACIIETDCNVDFDAPVGYQEPERVFPNGTNNGATATSNSSGMNSLRSSACPSPATTATSGGDNNHGSNNNSMLVDEDDNSKPRSKTRIVNGQIIRPDEYNDNSNKNSISSTGQQLLAPRTGATGIQRNAAIPEEAPEVQYWALEAGDGSRLDGKMTTPLKDSTGNVVDIRKLREEAFQRRSVEQAVRISKTLPQAGRTVGNGELVPNVNELVTVGGGGGEQSEDVVSVAAAAALAAPAVPISKRTKRIGTKYSKLKASASAFGGK